MAWVRQQPHGHLASPAYDITPENRDTDNFPDSLRRFSRYLSDLFKLKFSIKLYKQLIRKDFLDKI